MKFSYFSSVQFPTLNQPCFRFIQDESGKDGEPIPDDDGDDGGDDDDDGGDDGDDGGNGGGNGGDGGSESLRAGWIMALPLAMILASRR